MKYKKIALVTYNKYSELSDSDKLLCDPLRESEYESLPVAWDSFGTDWRTFDSIILRSMWDYHTRTDEFKKWLVELDNSGVTIWNDLSTVRWNMDKHYLRDLEKKEIAIIPTIYIEKNAQINVASILNQIESNEIIIKPAFGASAFRVFKTERQKAKEIETKINEYSLVGSVMVQPFTEQVKTEGEYSFMFFGGEFSHAILKQPSVEDFRTQSTYGATRKLVFPSQDLIDQAQGIVKKVEKTPLYARVDGLQINEKLYLMELELIEPHLFFDLDPESPARFVKAFTELMAEGK